MLSTLKRNYTVPHIDTAWADSRQTHRAVATAIHAIADSTRSAQDIWEAPTPAEWDHVSMAIEEYVRNGSFPPEEDGRYPWGQAILVLGMDSLNATRLER